MAYLPPTAALLDMVRDAGFVAVDARSLFTGAAQLVTATRGTAMSRPAAALRAPAAQLVVLERPLAGDVDPLVLQRLLPDPLRFHWERPSDGVAIGAVGAAAVVRDELTLPAHAIAVGGFAFDPSRPPSGPWRRFARSEWVVPRFSVIRRGDRAHLVAAAVGTADDAGRLAEAIERTAAALAAVRPPAFDLAPRRYTLEARSTPRAWRRAVEATLADIAAGRLAKLVLARSVTLTANEPLDPLRVVERLRRAFPGCAMFAIGRGPATFIGATPERLARVDGGRLDTAALAGTAPRGGIAREDRALGAALAASPKDRTEHAVVVDDLRARLAPLCRSLRVGARPVPLRMDIPAAPDDAHPRPRALGRDGCSTSPRRSIRRLPSAACRAAPRAPRWPRASGSSAAGTPAGVGWLDADGGEIDVAIRAALLRGPAGAPVRRRRHRRRLGLGGRARGDAAQAASAAGALCWRL